ncbi:hypothetical protein G6L37_06925 [Agrobacterium rubi]|nr:hypothetical protein [Agrobacterium rubi]NTF25098.1 hypothetical protein [Agrobacterium rubi]
MKQTDEGFRPELEGFVIEAPSFASPEDAMASAQRHHERSFPATSLRYDISGFDPFKRAMTLTRMARDVARAQASGRAPLYEVEGTWEDISFKWIEVAPDDFETKFGRNDKASVRLSDDGLWYSSLNDKTRGWQFKEEAFEAAEIGIRCFVEMEIARSSERRTDFEFVTIGKIAA